ncbi:MAG TPA: helical backbone metal receptor [Candidatus Margulisiibacteriota bacterium]|nr:helical backbone metal receptor [Candidatus Margulisiibacteriota bacterium]
MIEVVDDAGRVLKLAEVARRIVSLVPSLTETLVTLGCGNALVGVTRYCTEPPQALRNVERVGGTKNPDCGRIRALRPDLVLVNAEENRRADFDALERAGLTVFVAFPRRVRDVPALLEKLGALAGADAEARCLRDRVTEALRHVDGQERQRVFCPIWKNPWMSFNRDTYADDLLQLAGGENVCRERPQRYCTVTLEEIAATDPQVILLPDEPYVFSAKDLPALAPLAGTSALRPGRIHFIDGKALSWYGPRTAPALLYLRDAIAGGLE